MADLAPGTCPISPRFKGHTQVVETPGITAVEEAILQEDPEKRPACFESTIQEWLFILTATMSIGTSSFLYGICAVITAPIGRTLHMNPSEITWISASSA